MRAALTVFCDFDGTVTTRDVLGELLATLADPAWSAIETAWEQGRIGSRECLAKQIPLIRGGWPAIQRVLGTAAIDPTFAGYTRWCASQGVAVIVVSDGLDRVIERVLTRDRVRVDGVWANHLVVGEDGALSVTFPHPRRDLDCRGGLCKCRVLAQATTRRVVIGDGLSDLCWASRADVCFAKGRLLASCRAQQVACHEFEDFTTVQDALASLLVQDRDLSSASLLTR